MPALEFAGVMLGVREGVILLIVLVAIYMAFVLLRMRRLHKKPLPSAVPPIVPGANLSAQEAPEPALEMAAIEADDATSEGSEAWLQPSSGVAEGMVRHGLEQELAQLRDEVDAIRGELAALRGDLQQEVAHLHSAQSVSPIYGDAMQMASAGYDPVMIADRCGIARAEAELVVALAKSQMQ